MVQNSVTYFMDGPNNVTFVCEQGLGFAFPIPSLLRMEVDVISSPNNGKNISAFSAFSPPMPRLG